jgi:hypothetical protein
MTKPTTPYFIEHPDEFSIYLRALAELEADGLIARLPDGRWDLTEKGRAQGWEMTSDGDTTKH